MFRLTINPSLKAMIETSARIVSQLHERIYFHKLTMKTLSTKSSIRQNRLYSIMHYGGLPTLEEVVRLADVLNLDVVLQSRPEKADLEGKQ